MVIFKVLLAMSFLLTPVVHARTTVSDVPASTPFGRLLNAQYSSVQPQLQKNGDAQRIARLDQAYRALVREGVGNPTVRQVYLRSEGRKSADLGLCAMIGAGAFAGLALYAFDRGFAAKARWEQEAVELRQLREEAAQRCNDRSLTILQPTPLQQPMQQQLEAEPQETHGAA